MSLIIGLIQLTMFCGTVLIVTPLILLAVPDSRLLKALEEIFIFVITAIYGCQFKKLNEFEFNAEAADGLLARVRRAVAEWQETRKRRAE